MRFWSSSADQVSWLGVGSIASMEGRGVSGFTARLSWNVVRRAGEGGDSVTGGEYRE